MSYCGNCLYAYTDCHGGDNEITDCPCYATQPQDYEKWGFNLKGIYADCCGKRRIMVCRNVHYFLTYDGYDSMDSEICWKCFLSGQIHTAFHAVKRYFQYVPAFFKSIYNTCKNKNGFTLKGFKAWLRLYAEFIKKH